MLRRGYSRQYSSACICSVGTLDCMIPFQMCHAEVDLGPGLPGHAKCHLDDGIRVPADFPGTDGFRSYECAGTPYAAGDLLKLVRGPRHTVHVGPLGGEAQRADPERADVDGDGADRGHAVAEERDAALRGHR